LRTQPIALRAGLWIVFFTLEATMIDLLDDLGPILDAQPLKADAQVREDCGKCGGTGFWAGYGDCMGDRSCTRCKGRGYLVFRFTKSERDRRRQAATARAERKTQAALDSFAAEHPLVWGWLNAEAPRFEFAQSMLDALRKWGKLTERQLAAALKCAEQSAERQAKWQAQRAVEKAQAQAVPIDAIESAFERAKAAGIKWPKLRLDSFVFSPAGQAGKNPGAVYVKEGDTYLGKVFGGKLFKSRDCTSDQENRIVAAATDPAAAAIAYGKRFGACSVCGRELSNQESIDLGIGPVCAERFGF
jgi:hypothetical protein